MSSGSFSPSNASASTSQETSTISDDHRPVRKSYASESQHHEAPLARKSDSTRPWVDPVMLPNHGDVSTIAGNTPDYVKQLMNNTFFSYGVGETDCFGHMAGKDVKFTEVSVDRKMERQGRLEATTIAEVTVSKHMLNGARKIHGGCLAYLIDNCCSTPLVVLGLLQNVNGVGVTQAMNVLFHSPASMDTQLQIISTSVTLGGRIMTSRCEIINKANGRLIASAFLNKMQPAMSKL